MAGSPWSSSSSCTSSFGSLDEDIVCVVKPDTPVAASADRCVKFLCSYGGRILPRHTDGALRYVGGNNRVVSVDRSLHFYELQRKLRGMCGWGDVSLRCQLPTEDLDALVSVTCDDDLANLLEEYDAASKDRLQPVKIRAFLFPRTTLASPPPAPSTMPSAYSWNIKRRNYSPDDAAVSPTSAPRWWWAAASQQASPRSARDAAVAYQPQERPLRRYLVHNGSYWQ